MIINMSKGFKQSTKTKNKKKIKINQKFIFIFRNVKRFPYLADDAEERFSRSIDCHKI